MVRIGGGGAYYRSEDDKLSTPNRSKVNVQYEVKDCWAEEKREEQQVDLKQTGKSVDSNWDGCPDRKSSDFRAFQAHSRSPKAQQSRKLGDMGSEPRRGRLRPGVRGRPDEQRQQSDRTIRPLGERVPKRRDCGVKSKRQNNRERLATRQRQQQVYQQRSERREHRRKVQEHIKQEEYYLHHEELQQHLHADIQAVEGTARPRWSINNDKPLSRASSRGLFGVQDVQLDYHADKKNDEALREKKAKEQRSKEQAKEQRRSRLRGDRPQSAPVIVPLSQNSGGQGLRPASAYQQRSVERTERVTSQMLETATMSRPSSASAVQQSRRKMQPRSAQHVRMRPASAHGSPASY
jgi:hypothetical protein